MPKEKEDKDDPEREGFGKAMLSPRNESNRSRGGSEGMREVAGGEGGEDDSLGPSDEEASTPDEERIVEAEDCSIDWVVEDNGDVLVFWGEEGRSSWVVFTSVRLCLCGLSVIDVKSPEDKLPIIPGLENVLIR